MTKSMEPVPDQDDRPVPVIPQGYVSQVPVLHEPEWRAVVPPYRPDRDIERVWSQVMAPSRWFVRYLSDAYLWVTLTWYRALIVTISLIFVWSLVTRGS